MTTSLPTPPTEELSLTELRAWARASHKVAAAEGFVGVASRIEDWLAYFDALLDPDTKVWAVRLIPVTA
jgi:hypothetical protein